MVFVGRAQDYYTVHSNLLLRLCSTTVYCGTVDLEPGSAFRSHASLDAFQQPRAARAARKMAAGYGHVHHDAGQDRVSLGAPGPDLQLDRVRRPSRAKTAPLRPSPAHCFVFLD